jgi:lanosterol synthase
LLQHHPAYQKLIDDSRLQDAVDVLLSLQNPNGGFASYELARGGEWMEWINPAEVFGRIMVEYCYPECTTAVITALVAYRNYYPEYRRAEIDKAVLKAGKWVHSDQREDGSWYGSWGICFTYAGMFAMECLGCIGETYENSEAQFRACEFLVKHQNEDGGWGESYESCEFGVWTYNPDGSQVVNTAWALLGLMYAKYPKKEVLWKAIQVIPSIMSLIIVASRPTTEEWRMVTGNYRGGL